MAKALFYRSLLLCSCAFTACDTERLGEAHSHTGDVHSHGVAEVEPGIWPPTLSNISDQRSVPVSRRTRGSQVVVASARNAVMNNPGVRTALGDAFVELEASPGDAKSGVVASFLFFNYAVNQTVDTALLSDGTITRAVYDASDYQPSENASEVEAAISLATEVIALEGVDIGALHGTAMLAHPSIENNAIESSSRFYSERILYVTFGEGDGKEPVYRALVNLSRNQVLEHREILP